VLATDEVAPRNRYEESNEKKAAFLGMPFGTANARLARACCFIWSSGFA
jgi:hypothetical protein